jgi:GH25 family lysozyme M1 (1,4-beta-N-acetylmuramidase)
VTRYLWDTSHYDRTSSGGPLTLDIMTRAKAEGIDGVTAKIGEGTWYDDPADATILAAARAAGIEFLGGYHVVRSGAAVADQVDYLIRLADRDEPWWRDHPGWFWQVDLERWEYDAVPAATGIAFARELRRRTGRVVILYASRGQYGDQLTTWDGPLWNASYGTNPSGPFKDVYPGDSSTRWAPYSGKTPVLLQYGSRTTIAGVPTCDANAFRGTLAELRNLITGGAGAITGGATMSVWEEDVIPNQGTDAATNTNVRPLWALAFIWRAALDVLSQARANGSGISQLTASIAELKARPPVTVDAAAVAAALTADPAFVDAIAARTAALEAADLAARIQS